MLQLVTKEKKHIIEYMGAKFEVVPNTKDTSKKLIEKNTISKKIKKGPGKKFEYVEQIDFTDLLIDRIDTQITGWSGIDGNPKCTSENRRALATMKENEHICLHIIEEIENIGQVAEEETEKDRKN